VSVKSEEQRVACCKKGDREKFALCKLTTENLMSCSISVIIPAYNRANLIGETLRSLLNQTVPAKEIVVVDDGSTDGTAELVEREWRVAGEELSVKGRGMPELKVVRQGNAGPGAARNRGLAESTGEFIHFFDSDDIAAPNKHEVQLRALRESGADIAYGPWVKGKFLGRLLDGRRRITFEPIGHVLQQKGLPRGDLVRELLTRWSIVPQACLFRRSIVEKSAGFSQNIWIGEDQLFFLRCLLLTAGLVHTPDTLFFYRSEGDGKLTSGGDAQKKHARDWAKFLEQARRECMAKQIDPMAWPGFRMRVWQANQDLEKFGLLQEPTYCNPLPPLKMGEHIIFKIWSLFLRIRGGLTHRIKGDRQNASFRCGFLTTSQAAQFPENLA